MENCPMEEKGYEEGKQLFEGEYPFAKKLLAYLSYCDFSTVTMTDPDEEGMSQVLCREKEYNEALKQVEIFVQQESKRELEEGKDHQAFDKQEKSQKEEKKTPPSNVYQNYNEKAEENKSSAYSLFLIGGIGAVLVALSWFDLLPFSVGGKGNLLSHGVLFAFFVILVYLGFISAKSAGKYQAMVSKEAEDRSGLEKYIAEAFTQEILAEITAETEEAVYFKRMNYMREQVNAQFPETMKDGTLAEMLLDAHYDKLFG